MSVRENKNCFILIIQTNKNVCKYLSSAGTCLLLFAVSASACYHHRLICNMHFSCKIARVHTVNIAAISARNRTETKPRRQLYIVYISSIKHDFLLNTIHKTPQLCRIALPERTTNQIVFTGIIICHKLDDAPKYDKDLLHNV